MTMDVQPKASHFVNGAPMEDTAGAEMPLIYPATGERLGGPRRDAAVVEAALSSAEAAQAGWAAMTGAERGRVLTRAAAILRERNRELSELETMDTGKPLSETLVADAASGADCLEYFGGMAATLTGETVELGGRFRLHDPRTAGRLRGDRGVELPDPDRLLEGRAGAGLRQRDGLQTV
jgi:betaine-aldehyde dehydrogenase